MNLSGWRSKIEEINSLGLTEIALFLTGLGKEERKDLYDVLENTPISSIPHVHLRTDMALDEIDYLSDKYKVEAFNLHSSTEFPLQYDYGKYASKIFLENCYVVPGESELQKFGGLCIDFSHWEEKKLENDQNYCEKMERAVANYMIGCAHVSAIEDRPIPVVINSKIKEFSSHVLESMHELDYIKKYKKYLPNIISIELENPIQEQLEAKKYLENIINTVS